MTSRVGLFREVENRFLWLHRDEVRRRYAGQWIVLKGDSDVASAADEVAAETEARAAGIDAPYVVYMAALNVQRPILVPFAIVDPS